MKKPMCSICSLSTRPTKKKGSKNLKDTSEAEEVVASLMRNFSENKPLVVTLNKYVKFIRTEHFFMLFEELGKSGKWLQCLKVFRWMQKQRWYIADNGIYSKLISIMGKKGQTRMAMWLFSEMRNSGCLWKKWDDQGNGIGALSDEEAREVFDQLMESRKEKKVSTLNAMLEVCCRNGLPLEAETLFESAHTSKKFPIDSSTYKLLYKAYTNTETKELVKKLLVYMDKDGIVPNKRFFLDALGAIGSSDSSQKATIDARGPEHCRNSR